MEINLTENSISIFHALDSTARIDILTQLSRENATISQLANELHYSKAVISKHIKLLESVGLVHEVQNNQFDKRKRIIALTSDNINIVFPERIFPMFQRKNFDIPLGNYFSYQEIRPTCGLASKEAIIGKFDDPNTFLSPDRFATSLLWFSSGRIEYIFPNVYSAQSIPELLEISFELSSEFPGSNNNWPSDISFWINDIFIGTWTISGNFSDVRGKLTPSWWSSSFSQYGKLCHLRISRADTGMDGEQLSSINLSDLNLLQDNSIKFSLGIKESSPNQGGLTLFGKYYGNYAQNIDVQCYYSSKDS